MNTKSELLLNFEKSIKNPDLQNITANIIEVGIDSTMKSGALRDFSIIGTVIGIRKGVTSISDYCSAYDTLLFENGGRSKMELGKT